MSIARNLSFSTATSILAGTAGAIVYQSGVNTTAFLSIGTNGFVLTSNGSAPTWTAISGLTAGNATTATNIAAGTAGQLHYQSAPGITAFAGPGTAGQLLVSGGTGAPVYTNTSSIYINRAVLADTASAVTNAVTFNNGGSGAVSGTTFNGSAAQTISYNTFGAMPTTGGTFSGPVTFTQPVTFSGTATYVLSTNTWYTDNILELHVPPDGVTAPWFADDGKDIGLRFHYYANSTDTNAALVLDAATKELHWYSSGAESLAGDFSTGTYGIFRTGSIKVSSGLRNSGNTTTGDLQVLGGIGVGGGAFFGGIVTATNFSGSLSGGTAMSLVYQSAANTTAYLAAGSAGQILQTNGTGSAPTWVSITGLTAGNATTATNIAAGTAGQLHYQSAPGITAFISTATTGNFLQANFAGAPTWTGTGSIYVNRATLSDTSTNAATAYSTIGSHSAGTGLTGSAFNGSANQTWTLNTATLMATAVSAINLSAGSAMALPYQSASGTTAYLAAGTAGQILQTNGTGSAPTWVAATGLTAGNATTATNIAAGTAGQLHYQSAPGITAFAGPGSFGQFLMSTGAGAPVYQGTLTQSGGNILVTGSLGIGTASPTSLISLAGGTASTLGLTITPSGWNNARHRFTVPTSGDTSVWSFNYTGSAVDTSSYATSSISVGQANIAFSAGATNTAPSTIATINTTGLGVGTTSPASIFHVRNGSLFPQGRRGGSASAFFFENATVSDLYLELANTVTNYSGVLFSRAAAGNYGLINYNNATDNMVFYTAGAVQHTITSAGGFAFGSSQTAYGSSGQILQSNGNAPPTWVAATGLSAGTATTATQVNTVLQTASATYFPTFVDANNATSLAESLHTTSSFTINPSTGFVGVGTTNATVFSSLFPARLAVQGVGNQDPLIVRTDPAASNAAAAVFHQAATTPGFDAFRITTVGTSATQPALQVISGVTDATGAGGTSIFYVRQDGNIGIGTASPSYKLDVLSQNARIYSNSATSYALLRVGGTGSDSLFGYAGATNDIVTGAAAGDTVVGANKASANLRLTSGGGTINASLDSSGNLFLTNGISQLNTGFTNKLNINGSIVAGTATSTTGSIILQGQYGTGSITNLGTEYSSGGPVLSYGVYPSNAGTGAFFSSSGAALTRAAYTQAGNVHNWYVGNAQTVAIGSAATMSLAMSVSSSGINLPTPASGNANISFDGSTFTLVSNSSSAGLVLSTNSTERLRITSSGGFAFGGASNFGSSGQVLQSNGNAVPTWVSPTTLASASATNADNLRTIQQTASGTYYPAFVDSNNSTAAYEAYYTTSSFVVNPLTGASVHGAGAGFVDSYGNANNTYKLIAYNVATTSTGVDDVIRVVTKYNAPTGASAAVGNGPAIVFAGGIGDNQTRDRARIVAVYEGSNVSGLAFHTQTNADTIAERVRIQNNGNVGIGTTTPPNKLTVSNGGAVGLEIQPTGGYTGLGGVDLLAYNRSSAVYAPIGFITNSSNNSMVILTNGNVGIGTTSPGAKFTINNAGSTSAAFYADIGNPGSSITLFEHTGASTPVPFRLKKSGYSGASPNYGLFYLHMNDGTVGNGSNLYFTLNNSASAEIEYGGLGAIIRSNTAGSEQGDLAFYVISGGTGRTERMRITSAGAIAFSGSTNYGTSGQILQSNGNAAPTWVNASGITSGATSLTSTQVGFGSGSNLLTGSANLTYASSILNVAYQNTFNTSTPGFGTYGIHLNGQTTADSATGITFSAGGASAANANAGIYSQGSGSYGSKMYFATTDSYAVGSKTRMMIDQAGNVGIGTVAPISRLQVGNNTFSGVHGVYSNARSGLSVNGSLTSIVYASTYNDSTYPDYGMVFVHGPSTSNYNVWSISPDGPAKGSGLGFLYGASTDNIHVSAPKVYFQGSTGNVGIGTSAPDSRLHVEVGNATAYTPANTLVSGQTARISNTDGTSGVSANLLFVAKGAGGGNGLGSISGVNTGVGSLAFTFGTRHSSSNVTERMRITSDGNVGIGTSNPINKFEISGDAGQLFSVSDSFTGTIFSANDVSGIPSIEVLDTGLVKFAQYNGAVAIGTGTVSSSTAELSVYGMLYTSGPQGEIRASNEITAYFSSDARLKENIKLIENPITIIDQIRGVTFDWTDEHLARRGGEDGYFVRKHDIGVIAQEVQAVLPELVGTREDGYLAVKYEKLVPLLIEAIKAQQTTIETLTSEIKEIKDFLSSLKK